MNREPRLKRRPLRRTESSATSAKTSSGPRLRPRARKIFSIATRRTIPSGRTISRRACVPAFGSLRVGLRMRRTATILSGSACCVYGLTFTSHFYGARRTVGYVPFDSETFVTGKLFEDIRDAVHELADPRKVRRGRCHQPVRADRVRRAASAAAEDDQRRTHHRHRRAGLRRADPRGGQRRACRRDAGLRDETKPSRARSPHRAAVARSGRV